MEGKEIFKNLHNFKSSTFIASFDDKLCITCMFWTGHRKREENSVIAISENVEGICLWHSNSSTKVSYTCKHWIGKYLDF
ncbi:MAG: hypothetical protein ACK4MM_03285 [Fervidobacterium sp.]